MPPVVYLLCGLPGTGKTTHARQLETEGALRLSLDEEVLSRGRAARQPQNQMRLDEAELRALEAAVAKEQRASMLRALRTGRSVVLDNGFWFRKDRDEIKRLAETVNAHWKLLYFPANEASQRRWLDRRNAGDLTSSHYISEAELEVFKTRFEPPDGEGEELVSPDGMSGL